MGNSSSSIDVWTLGLVAAGIPVILVNAEINQEGLAKAQLVSNNAQGAALGAQQWVESVGETGKYVELFGAPSDNNAALASQMESPQISCMTSDLKPVFYIFAMQNHNLYLITCWDTSKHPIS